MKRSLIAPLLGLAALVAVPAAHAQGNINFCNYNFSASMFAPVYIYATLEGPIVGPLWGNAFSAQLYYSATSNPGPVANFATWGTAVGSPTAYIGANPGDPGAGFFNGGTVTVPQSLYNAPVNGAALPAYFRVYSYATADVTIGSVTYPASWLSGWSDQISCSTLATAYNLHLAGDLMADNADVLVPMQPTPTPEPSTLALAGLGGFGLLMALRRKKV